jgi:threonine/homoserine/homoserine lactone efflux protein
MEIVFSILAFCLVTSITPGPNNIMLMTSGLNHGVHKSLPHLFGILIGFPVMVACIGLGLGAIFHKFPIVHQLIKVFGFVYLLFLAWKIANAGNPSAGKGLKEPLTFIQAVVFQWLNPKAWVIAVGAIATYTTVGNVGSQLIIILVGFLTVGSLSMTLWLLLGTGLQKILSSRWQLQCFNICMAILLTLSVVSMAILDFTNGV